MLSARLSHVGLQVPDPRAVADFYVRVLGLRVVEDQPDGPVRLAGKSDFHQLELSTGEGFGHLALELPDGAALAVLERRLRERGVAVAVQDIAGEHPEVLVFHDADGNRIEAHSPPSGSERTALGPGPAIGIQRAVGIHHVTFSSVRLGSQLAFYEEAMGFRLSDRMSDSFVWLRCNHEHHTVAVVQAAGPELDHYAYEVGSWEALKLWCDHLAALDVPIRWGPGRHGPGNNLFVMFDDPAGNRVELSCEMERYWDEVAEYAPRLWRPEPKTVNLWGPMPEWRRSVTQ